VTNFLSDLRYALRTLAGRPGFTAVAVLTLALGIGATTSIFSVFNAVLLRPLPFPDGDRLVLIEGSFLRLGMQRIGASAPEFLEYRDRNHSFAEVAAFRPEELILTGEGEAERVVGARVSAGLFPLLRAQAFKGRILSAEEDRPGADGLVVLSHGLWQRRFGSDPVILGKTLLLDGRERTVIGVMPPEFTFPIPGLTSQGPADLFVPLALTTAQQQEHSRYDLRVLARLGTGVQLEAARKEMALLAADLERREPRTYRGPGGEEGGWNVEVIPLREWVVSGVRPTLWMLLGAVCFVLLIACANVAGLLVGEGIARRHAIAVRLALGCGQFRLVVQLLAESLVLAFIGGSLGVLLTLWGSDLMVLMSPAGILRMSEIRIDGAVLGFALAASALTALASGLAPAILATRIDIGQSLKEGGTPGSGAPGTGRSRDFLVVAQVAFALALTIGAALMIQSFQRLRHTSPGFRPENLLTMDLQLPESRYARSGERAAFFQELVFRAETLPGVRAAGVVSGLPLQGVGFGGPLSIDGRPLDPNRESFASYRSISGGYFQAMGIPIRRGRRFGDADGASRPEVAIVNESLARAFFPGESPLDKRIKLGAPTSPRPWLTVVGVVGDVSESAPGSAPAPAVYVPNLQDPASGLSLVVRTSASPLDLVPAIRALVRELDKDQPVTRVRTVEQIFSDSISRPRFITALLALSATLALLLAAVGVYAVVSAAVAARSREIGLRVAVGAGRSDILGLVLWRGVRLALLGIAAGFLVTGALTGLLSRFLFGVGAYDPLTFAGAALLLTLAALAASYVPARKATRIDPMLALRHD